MAVNVMVNVPVKQNIIGKKDAPLKLHSDKAQNNGQQVAVIMTGQIFFSPDKPRFWPVK